MVMTPDRNVVHILGANLQGDFGPWTCYISSRGKLVLFKRAPPTSPPSLGQQRQRDLYRAAAHLWQNLSTATRATWELATKRLSLGLTGYNLWVWYTCTNKPSVIRTIERQSGLTLLA